MVKDLGKHRWRGHSVLMGKTEAGFQDIGYVLNLLPIPVMSATQSGGSRPLIPEQSGR